MVDSKEAYGEDYNYEEDPEVAAEREREMEAKLERELTNELEEDTIRYCTELYWYCTVLYCTILYVLHTIRMMDEIRYGDDTGVSSAGREDKLSLSLASLFFFSCFLSFIVIEPF